MEEYKQLIITRTHSHLYIRQTLDSLPTQETCKHFNPQKRSKNRKQTAKQVGKKTYTKNSQKCLRFRRGATWKNGN